MSDATIIELFRALDHPMRWTIVNELRDVFQRLSGALAPQAALA